MKTQAFTAGTSATISIKDLFFLHIVLKFSNYLNTVAGMTIF